MASIIRCMAISASIVFSCCSYGAGVDPIDESLLGPPAVGFHRLRILSPTVLELTLVNTKQPVPEVVPSWNLVENFQFSPPQYTDLAARIDGQAVPIQAIGFKRRPLYAPLATRDLRIGNQLYLQLVDPVAEGQSVEVLDFTSSLWLSGTAYTAVADPLRYSPAIHVNQEGYIPQYYKKAVIGYFLGSLGELDLPAGTGFTLVDADTGTPVFQGSLTPRADFGYTYTPAPYQKVWEADFTPFTTPGQYRLVVPGLGASLPFRVDDAVAMSFLRTYALGLYHQRCGTSNALPYTRFTHEACHVAPAAIPAQEWAFPFTWRTISNYATQSNPDHPLQMAPLLTNSAAQLFPYVNLDPVDVSGGHHDAGDYSKYTINSAMLVHCLMFAVDSFPGVAAFDNLGLPESGDGISDVMQEAKWEADFLAKMQDSDGGFYFLVYPRNREYENNVLPDHGDAQVVWPKTSSATAAGVAALAQCASSPLFRQVYPEAASNYLARAQLGWAFLTNAINARGKTGIYQKITHYGDDFNDQDELAWAACEMFLATGDPACHDLLKAWFPDPAAATTFRWTWWRLFGSYGNAIRTYAFSARNGRLSRGDLDPAYLAKCETQILAAGNDTLAWSRASAYGTSFPPQTKAVRAAGWYFSSDQAFDLTVAYQIDPRLEYADAILQNLNYEAGCNPLNVSFVTGLGWKRQREIVHQFAQNDRRVLPPGGIPLGNIQANFDYLGLYQSELGALCFPSDGAGTVSYPFYDRWADAFNVTTEFVAVNQARSLGSIAFLATISSLTNQPSAIAATFLITGLPAQVSTNSVITASLDVSGLDVTNARIIWEARGEEPAYGSSYTFSPLIYGPQWVEVEIQWPDGRRAYAVTNFFATNGLPSVTVQATRPFASEVNRAPGEFTVFRTGDSSTALTVNYQLSGTATKFNDYRRSQGDMPDFVVIPAGSASTTVTIFPVDDQFVEGPETATLTLLQNAAYNVDPPTHATVSIDDNDLGILSITHAPDGNVTVTWVSIPGKFYRISSKTALQSVDWSDSSDAIPAFGGVTSWTDADASSSTLKFYRVQQLP